MPDEKDLNQSENQPNQQPDNQPVDGQAQEEPVSAAGNQAQPETPAGDAQPAANAQPAGDEIPEGFVAVGESDPPADNGVSDEEAEEEMLKMLNDLPPDDTKVSAEEIDFGTSDEVSKAEFQNLQQPAGSHDPQNIDLLMDVDLPVSIELGRTRMSISDILSLGPGSVVELNKLAGEPVDLLVNNKQVARGEVVVVDENFGLRITQLMTPEERLKSLGKE